MEKPRKQIKKDRSIDKSFWSMLVMFVLFSALFYAVSAQTYAVREDERTGQEHVGGLIPVKKEVHHIPGPENKKKGQDRRDLPERYRSNEQLWSKGIRVMDQDETSLCWAFSVITAAEYSYAKEIYKASGAVSEMSPGHLGYFFYNRVNDPLGLTSGDRNRTVTGKNWIDCGGNQIYAMQHMATYSGLGLEDHTPFDEILDCIKGAGGSSYFAGMTFDRYDKDYAYDNYATLQESIFLTGDTLYKDSVEAGKNKIKQMVWQYGAVSTGCSSKDIKNGYQTEEGYEPTTLYSSAPKIDHAVTIIGWDDNFSKEKFKNAAVENNGAWIIQNSWGFDKDNPESGFIYASYESKDLLHSDMDFTAFDMQPADSYHYNFQYDGTADCGDSSDRGNEKFYTDKGCSAANIYTNTTGHPLTLDAVCFTTYNDGNSNYLIDVYAGIWDENDPLSGERVGGGSGVTDTPGVKTISLNQPAQIEAGETFSIVFTFPTANHFGVERYRNESFDIEADKGQSFFRAGGSGSWVDIGKASPAACFRIKGLANVDSSSHPQGSCGAGSLGGENEDPVSWKLLGNRLFISGTGAMADYPLDGDETSGKAPWHAYRQEIRAIIIGDGVTRIGSGAFAGLQEVSTVMLGSGVAEVGEDAFYQCPAKHFYASSGTQGLTVSEDGLLTGDGKRLIAATPREETYVVPAGVLRIDRTAFSQLENLETVVFAGDLPESFEESFCDCSKLSRVIFAGSSRVVGELTPADVFVGGSGGSGNIASGIDFYYPGTDTGYIACEDSGEGDHAFLEGTDENRLHPFYRVAVGSRSGGGTAVFAGSSLPACLLSGGKVKLNQAYCPPGEPVTITVSADTGYDLSELTYTTSDGQSGSIEKNSEGQFALRMPESDLTVSAVFKEQPKAPAPSAGQKESGTPTESSKDTAEARKALYQKQYKAAVKAAKKIRGTVLCAKPVKGRKLLVKWKKVKKVSGYQLRLSTDRKFKKSVKKVTIKKAGKTKVTLKKLKARKVYYVKIRTYKKIKNKATGKTALVYGKWSKTARTGKIR